MKCPKCRANNRKDAQYCKKCGQSLHAELVCKKCQHPNTPDSAFCDTCGHSLVETAPEAPKPSPEPTSFVNGRYQVKKFLGEGGKKKVYLVHDKVLDRDVVFALIKTEKLDDVTRLRVSREAQVMGRLDDHPNIMTIHDMGDERGQPYIVLPPMSGGDVGNLVREPRNDVCPLSRQSVLPRPSVEA